MEETIRQSILYLREVLGLSFYQIQDRTGISRKRASRIYRGSCQNKRQKRDFILDPYRSLIAEWFKEHPTLKAQQVHGWLKTRGVKISYPAVVKYTRGFRKKVPKEPVEKVTFLKTASSAESKIGIYFLSSKVFTILGARFLFSLYFSYHNTISPNPVPFMQTPGRIDAL
jgi:transcriptional regulator with XRE-family HTH domain